MIDRTKLTAEQQTSLDEWVNNAVNRAQYRPRNPGEEGYVFGEPLSPEFKQYIIEGAEEGWEKFDHAALAREKAIYREMSDLVDAMPNLDDEGIEDGDSHPFHPMFASYLTELKMTMDDYDPAKATELQKAAYAEHYSECKALYDEVVSTLSDPNATKHQLGTYTQRSELNYKLHQASQNAMKFNANYNGPRVFVDKRAPLAGKKEKKNTAQKPAPATKAPDLDDKGDFASSMLAMLAPRKKADDELKKKKAEEEKKKQVAEENQKKQELQQEDQKKTQEAQTQQAQAQQAQAQQAQAQQAQAQQAQAPQAQAQQAQAQQAQAQQAQAEQAQAEQTQAQEPIDDNKDKLEEAALLEEGEGDEDELEQKNPLEEDEGDEEELEQEKSQEESADEQEHALEEEQMQDSSLEQSQGSEESFANEPELADSSPSSPAASIAESPEMASYSSAATPAAGGGASAGLGAGAGMEAGAVMAVGVEAAPVMVMAGS